MKKGLEATMKERDNLFELRAKPITKTFQHPKKDQSSEKENYP